MWQEILAGINAEAVLSLISAALTGLAGYLWKRYTEARPKLVSFFVHSAAVHVGPNVEPHPHAGQPVPGAAPVNGVAPVFPPTVTTPAFTVHTHAVVIRNSGGKAANNLRLGHHILPAFSIAPPVNHVVEGKEIRIPALVPNEVLTITYIYPQAITWNQVHAYEKSDEVLVQHARYVPQPVYGRWVYLVANLLVFLGASVVVYFGLRLLYMYLIAGSGAVG